MQDHQFERTDVIRLLVALCVSGCCCHVFGQQVVPGIIDQKPVTGKYVTVGKHFLVPYTETIPGTDVKFQMVPVPANREGETPFWIGKHEVRFREYAEFSKLHSVFANQQGNRQQQDDVKNEADLVTAPTVVYNSRDRFEGVNSLDCPAYSMTQFAAKQYTKWLSLLTLRPFRLPTEQEWERAASFHIPEVQLEEIAVCDYTTDHVVAVGSRKPNRLGIHDLYGNVSEWVITRITVEPKVDHWPPLWIHKGGSFASRQSDCQSTSRGVVSAHHWNGEANYPLSSTWLGSYDDRVRIGFRIVRVLGELDKISISPYWAEPSASFRQQVEHKLHEGRNVRGRVSVGLPSEIKTLPEVGEGLGLDWLSDQPSPMEESR